MVVVVMVVMVIVFGSTAIQMIKIKIFMINTAVFIQSNTFRRIIFLFLFTVKV